MSFHENLGEHSPHDPIPYQVQFLHKLTDQLLEGTLGTMTWESRFEGDEIEVEVSRSLFGPYSKGSFMKLDDGPLYTILNIAYASPVDDERTFSAVLSDDGEMFGQFEIDQNWEPAMLLGSGSEKPVSELIEQLQPALKTGEDIDDDTADVLRELTHKALEQVIRDRKRADYDVFDPEIGIQLSQKLLEVATRPNPYAHVHQKFARSVKDQSVHVSKRPMVNTVSPHFVTEFIEWRQQGVNKRAIAKLEVHANGMPYVSGTPDLQPIDVPPTVIEPLRAANPSEIASFLKLLQDDSLL